jgi:hypothetical protein
MSGIFPASGDGGLPANPDSLTDPASAYPPIIAPTGTAALYYGNSCDVRLRPEVVNSLISEVEATIDIAGLAYDPAKQINLQLAIRYLIQQGKMKGGVATGGPFNYTLALQPPVKAYNDYLALWVVPRVTNQGAVTLKVDLPAPVSVLRNDSQPLQADDWRGGIPIKIVYYQGVFYLGGMARSQMPQQLIGDVNAWIRTDGNDFTGDGTANSADKAFRTINGAWTAMSTKYAVSTRFGVNLRLGIPGTYEAGNVGPYGGRLGIFGNDSANIGTYRIGGIAGVGGAAGYCVACNAVNSLMIEDVTLAMDKMGAFFALNAAGSNVAMRNANVEMAAGTNPLGSFIGLFVGAVLFTFGEVKLIGNGNGAATIFTIMGGSNYGGALVNSPGHLTYSNASVTAGIQCTDLSLCNFAFVTATNSGVVGPSYSVAGNSVINMRGQTAPGNAAGSAGTGGQFIA